jgi:nicotinamide riboside kinase
MPATRYVALLGAESTGKTELAQALAAHWRAQGRSVAVVAEVLREWCQRQGRTPQAHEQLLIAAEQARRTLAASADLVIADTTPLMTAVYSEIVFADRSLYTYALDHHRLFHHTLLTGLDLPWVADGLQRDNPAVRAPVDALVRSALNQAKMGFQVIYGQGEERLNQALRALGAGGSPGHGGAAGAENATDSIATSALTAGAKPRNGTQTMPEHAPWVWSCEKCSDPACEHRLFTGLRLSTAADFPRR